MGTLYDPVEGDLETFRNTYVMSPELWEKFDISDLGIDFTKWEKVKLMDEKGGLNEQISNIPNSYGGIYIYVMSARDHKKCMKSPEITAFVTCPCYNVSA